MVKFQSANSVIRKFQITATNGLATPTFSDIYIGYNADASKIMAKFRNFIRSFGTIKIR